MLVSLELCELPQFSFRTFPTPSVCLFYIIKVNDVESGPLAIHEFSGFHLKSGQYTAYRHDYDSVGTGPAETHDYALNSLNNKSLLSVSLCQVLF